MGHQVKEKAMRQSLVHSIHDFVGSYRSLKATRTDWEEPLVTSAYADDALFQKLKQILCKDHFLPVELLPSAKSVVSFFIPFKKGTALSNQSWGMPSKEWIVSYLETNRLILDLNEHVKGRLQDQGFLSVGLPPTHNFDPHSLLSRWSHKHVGFIAGLGRFGLHQMLITEKGCCGRLGSLITSMEVKPTPKKDSEYCLNKVSGSCKKCVEKCVNGALQVTGLDRHKCYKQLQLGADDHGKLHADVCGKCVCTVPCSFVNPASLI